MKTNSRKRAAVNVDAVIPAPFSPLLDDDVYRVVEESGRSSGKSTTNETVAVGKMMEHENNNIWYCRAERNDIRGSIYSSMTATIDRLGLSSLFKFSVSPLQITCKTTGAVCYFDGINGKVADDLNATKGFTPRKSSLAMFILDEANEAKTPMHVRAAESTAEKFLNPGGKIVYAYNPPPVRTHWAHQFFGRMVSEGATRIYSTYKDVYGLLKPATIKAIEEMRVNQPRQFAYWYLGQMVSLEGLVLYTFSRERNLVPMSVFLENVRRGVGSPIYIIYGVDSGLTKDATAVCAWGVMPDGTLLKLSTMYLRPDGSPVPNTIQVQHIAQWYREFYARFRSFGVALPGPYNECWVFDNAVVTQDLMYEFAGTTGYKCNAVQNKDKDRDIKRLQNGYYRQMFKILDIPDNSESIREIETFVYDENNEIPDGQDDHTIDADKYATAHFYYGRLIT